MSNTTILKNGDEVYGFVTGGYAEYTLAVANEVQPKPARLVEDAGKAQNIRAVSAGRASADTLKQASELIEAKQLQPIVGEVFTLVEARRAHELSQTGHGRGRIILQLENGKSR